MCSANEPEGNKMSPRKILELDVYQNRRRQARTKVNVPQGDSQVITLDRIRAIRHTAIETKSAASAPTSTDVMKSIHRQQRVAQSAQAHCDYDEAPEVDLSALKERIAVGDYPIDPRAIARSILEDLMPGQCFETSSIKVPAHQK